MNWMSRQLERIVGYEPVGSWRGYRLDPRRRRGNSLPERVPVPKTAWKEWGRKQRPERLSHAQVAGYAREFIDRHPQHPLSAQLRALVKKAPLAAKVEEALGRQAWDEAEALLQQVTKIDPADQRARLLMGLCLLERGEVAAAQELAVELGAAMSAEPDFHLLRGRIAERQGELDQARECYRQALALQGDHPVVLERMAALGEMVEVYLGDLDNMERAFVPREAYEKVIIESWENEPREIGFFLERSEFHLRNAQPSLALAAADHALEAAAGPGAAQIPALAARTRALIALERFSEAAAALAQLQALDPEGEATLACRGQLLWFTDRRAEAAEIIRRAIAANPNRMENLNLFLDADFPRVGSDRLDDLKSLAKTFPQSWAVAGITATLAMAQGDWNKGAALAVEAASLGASDELLIELTGRMGRQGLHQEVGKLVAWAGGWGRFRESHPMLRCNLAASLLRNGEEEAARTLYGSVVDDGDAHPEIRMRARRALDQPTAPNER